MTSKKRTEGQTKHPTQFEVTLTPKAKADFDKISDQSTAEAISRRLLELRREPSGQGKQLKGGLKNYRSVRAAGQRYRILYQVAVQAGQVIVVVIGIRKAGDRRDAYAVAEKRLG